MLGSGHTVRWAQDKHRLACSVRSREVPSANAGGWQRLSEEVTSRLEHEAQQMGRNMRQMWKVGVRMAEKSSLVEEMAGPQPRGRRTKRSSSWLERRVQDGAWGRQKQRNQAGSEKIRWFPDLSCSQDFGAHGGGVGETG